MTFSSTTRPPVVDPVTARALLLPTLPRRLRACLDTTLRVPAARIGLAAEVAALAPATAPLATAWTKAMAAAGSEQWRDPGVVDAVAALIRALDADAAAHDRPELRALADMVVLLTRGGDDTAAAARLALPLWCEFDTLSDLVLRHSAIAEAQTRLTLARPADPEDGLDATFADDGDMQAALLTAWTEALGQALLDLRAEASAAVAAAAALGSGAVDDFAGGVLLVQALAAFGMRLTGPLTEQVERRERDRRRRVEAALAASEARNRAMTATAKTAIGRAGEEARPVSVPAAVPAGYVLVVAGIQETGHDRGKSAARGYERIIGRPLPLAPTPDLAAVRSDLFFEFPYAAAVVDRLLADLVGRPYATLRPSVLVGPPGAGKSRLAARLSHHLGLGLWRVDATRDSGACIGGLDRRWSSAEPCHPLMAMNRYSTANPIMLVDEIEKAATRSDYGRLWDALLPMLEPETARHYADPAFQVEVDLSHVSWIATANRVDPLPGPLLDRLRVIEMPEPGPGDLDALLPPVLAGIAAARGLDVQFLPALDGAERRHVRQVWRGGSVRRLIRVVEAIVAARDAIAPRH